MACQNQVLRGPLHITLFFLQVLRQKAEERNPDEFYFAMEKARTRNGVHIAPTAEANKYSQEELRLMKTQDIGYLQLKAQTEAKVGAALSRKHAVGVRWGAKPSHTLQRSVRHLFRGARCDWHSRTVGAVAPVPPLQDGEGQVANLPETGDARPATARPASWNGSSMHT